MQTYRVKNKPNLKVKAAQLTAENVDELANWCQGQIIEEGRGRPDREAINVKTPDGKMRLHQGMYLVEIAGKFYTAAAVNFEQRYELDIPETPPPPAGPLDDPWEGVPRIGDES